MTPMHKTPFLITLLFGSQLAASMAHGASLPPLLPATLRPDGLRLQATFADPRPGSGLAVLAVAGGSRQLRPGADLGNGLTLLQVLSDRIVLQHGNGHYYLPLQGLEGQARSMATVLGPAPRPAAVPSAPLRAAATATGQSFTAASAPVLQANNHDDVRQQCQSAAVMSQLSAAQRQEIQALGLCP